ncbi:hypothetical protein ACFFTO_17575 [Amycolatopsis plumensis]|uniref:Uncharacterized protein n=1 Tax=Amycolatopsis plumensis TaxID=236508 RepID=A0ABV5U3N2_9PSEU
MKTVKVVGVSGLVVTVAMRDWTGIALVVVAIIVAFCWVLDDHDRAKRLTLLVSTWRHGTSTPPRRRAVSTVPRTKPPATGMTGPRSTPSAGQDTKARPRQRTG